MPTRPVIAITLMATIFMTQASSEEMGDPKTITLSDAGAVQRGEIAYGRTCSMCHGHAGQGGTGKPLAGRRLDPDRTFTTISNGQRRGSRNMPPFGKSLSAEQRWELVAYLLSLGVDERILTIPTGE